VSYIIYALCDPRFVEYDPRRVFYIGKSQSGLSRAKGHSSSCLLKKDDANNWQKSARIRELIALFPGTRGYTIDVLAELPAPRREADAAERLTHASALGFLERVWIRALRATGAALLNRTDGGENIVPMRTGKPTSTAQKIAVSKAHKGKPKSAEQRRLMSEAQLGEKNHQFGKITPDSVKEKLSASLTGRVFSDLHRARLSRPKSDAERQKLSQATKKRWAEKKAEKKALS